MSYYSSSGVSPWRGSLEDLDDAVSADDHSDGLETCNNSSTQEMVRQPLFHHIF